MSTPGTTWADPPATLALAPDEVHIWRLNLDGWGDAARATLYRTLSEDERRRADRFYFERDRVRFTVARGVLRTLLGRYLGAAPTAVRFAYSAHGKPSLANHGHDLRFNLSHSHQLAILAMARGRELGVDVEHCVRERSGMAIAARFFAASEVTTLAGLPPDQQVAGFFNCWTRKEAYIKAHGAGLSLPLDQFAVSLAPGEPARLLCARDPAELARWSLHTLDPGPDYMAALAVEGHDCQLRCYQWRPEEIPGDDAGLP